MFNRWIANMPSVTSLSVNVQCSEWRKQTTQEWRMITHSLDVSACIGANSCNTVTLECVLEPRTGNHALQRGSDGVNMFPAITTI